MKKLLSLILILLLSVMLSLTACFEDNADGPGQNSTEAQDYKDIYLTVKNGFLSTGKTKDNVPYGEKVTLYAEELPGMFFDHWTKNGVQIEGGAEYVYTADERSTSDSPKVSFVAVYRRSDFASFEDIEPGRFTSLLSDRYTLLLSTDSDKIFAEVISDTEGGRNNVLKYVDEDPTSDGFLHIDIAASVGDFLVYSLDFLVESCLGSVPLSIRFGSYTIDFYSTEDRLKICDLNQGTTAYLKTSFEIGEWHKLRVYVSNTTVNGKYPHSYILFDGECIAESYNVSDYSMSSTVSLYTSEQSEIVLYTDNMTAFRTDLTLDDEVAMEPDFTVERGYVNTGAYAEAELVLTEDAFEALKKMDSTLFSEDIYRWIAALFDPETSAIYFSISGRDNYGYLPDIETVSQAYGILSTLGIGSANTLLSDAQKANLLSWIQTLQSNRDGYYYHPQWGVSISNSRLSRDLSYSTSSYSPMGSRAYRLFDEANYRLSGGSTGTKGITTPSAYDNNLTVKLTSSSATAVSKLLLTSSVSSMPDHLQSEEKLVRYINDLWNTTCPISGTHERHFCTDACVIEEAASDSYMRITDGKLVITRGYRCTSCHSCAHTLGHSYAFGHHVTSMGSQIKAAGLGTPTVMYFYDIQENVQASLRDKAEAEYIEKNGISAWNSLSKDEQTKIRKSAENGIWEEKVTYNTISGLLKICGIPTEHGHEFLYAKEAINSAIDGALFSTEDFINRREDIVSIYNPFNAINGIMNNIAKYGSDQSIRTEAMELVRRRAKALIDNTAVKLACYLMPDGGYSYAMSGYCTHSQGQPVAVYGWNGGVGEGDVNGTALALGTRNALIKCLGLTVGAPFSGERSRYSEEGYDLNCDGVIDEDELDATHSEVFISLITNKSEIEKIDTSRNDKIYDFEGDSPLMPSSGTVISDEGNNVLSVADESSDDGVSASFLLGVGGGYERFCRVGFDMKVERSNDTMSHQILIDPGILRIDLTYNNGSVIFANSAQASQTLEDKDTGEVIRVNADSWFSVELKIYPYGSNIGGSVRYGIFSVTQNGETQSAYLEVLKEYGKEASQYSISSLNYAKTVTLYDNLVGYNTVNASVTDGEYNFDTVTQQVSDKITSSPTNSKDKVIRIDNKYNVGFLAHQYSTGYVTYDFNFFMGSVQLAELKPSGRVYYRFNDASESCITGIYLEMNEDRTLSFYAINGQKLQMANTENGALGLSMTDMTVNADLSKWITVKLEYHYDMDEPQLDVTVRYADGNNNSYYRSVAATLTDVSTRDESASASGFTIFEISCEATTDTSIYADDLYIRNVYE